MKKPKNFQEGIHTADFWDFYKEKLIQDSVIADFSREKISLNGDWKYGIDQYDTCLRNRWWSEHEYDGGGRALPLDYSFDEWESVEIPCCWNLQSEKLFLYEGGMVYTRKFTTPPISPLEEGGVNERVFIKFGGVSGRAAVFVNKAFMGLHEGSSTPFCVEVTDVLQPENRILVAVNNTRRADGVPMDNTDWFNYGGIYRDVELIRLPEVFIKAFHAGFKAGNIFARVSVDGAESGTAVLRIRELGIEAEFDIKNGVSVPASPELWDVDNPKLYDVEIEFGGDKISDKIGFREISVQGREILLNGRSIFLRGISAHEESVKNGKAVTEEEIRENYALAKEMNCNFMRLAHYPHSEAAARIADEVGILLWEEIPVYWAIEFHNPETYDNAENQLTELITRDINRASVVVWSVGNENPDTDSRFEFMGRLADKAREIDGTRPITAACLVDHGTLRIADRLIEKLDIIGINEYYGWYDPDFSKPPKVFENSSPEKPVIISEFGADCKAGFTQKRGTRDDMFSEEFQLDVYKKQIETLSAIEYIKGISPWIFYDFRCPRRLHYMQDYYNIKGLLSADKKYKKKAFYAMQKFYEKKEKDAL
ncbi:MAG: glycoside hydrolase family 2 [Oscillospiraceae bacterium]|nr:glycoside hydrolase family 2 [Oscillospiraceae bacterium]